jgi:catechol 2,3-dioxygenase-like lactoylglutathione lyase family enzyme
VSRPELVSLSLADPPGRWDALGFEVRDDRMRLGAIEVELGAPGDGIVGWSVRGVEDGAAVDGLPWRDSTLSVAEPAAPHPNGAVGLDHVVVLTPDFDRTAAALDAAGLSLRRVRDAGGFRQGFRRLGPAILELVEAKGAPVDQPARFWGLVVIVSDLGALSERLGDRLAPVKDAVQPGRRIATLRRPAGIGTNVAFMDPE